MIINSEIPSLLGGVSQQPYQLRLPSQLETCTNAFPSEIEGLGKRNPLIHIAKINSTVPSTTAKVHWIDRDSTHRYCILANYTSTYTTLTAFDLNGTSIPIYGASGTTAPDFSTYLNTTPANIRFCTVADYTFVANTAKTVTIGTVGNSALTTGKAYLWVRSGAPKSTLELRIKQSGASSTQQTITVKTDWGQGVNPSTGEIDNYKTEDIAAAFITKATGQTQGLSDLTGDNQVTATRYGNIVEIVAKSGQTITEFSVWDSQNNTMLVGFNGAIDYFEDLPTRCSHGYVVKIRGDQTTGLDDRFVKFVADAGSGFSEGTWTETTDFGSYTTLTGTTMPYQLTYDSGSSCFRWQPVTWITRQIGNDTTNPPPTFVNSTIKNIFFYKNRLGFLSGQNVILSEASRYFNFFKTSVTDVLDADPIDVGVQTQSVLYNAVSHNEKLWLFTEFDQFMLYGYPTLTPKTVTVENKAHYQNITTVAPVPLVNELAFASNKTARVSGGGYAASSYGCVRALYTLQDSGEAVTADLTSHVQAYIENTINNLVVNSQIQVLVVQTVEKPNWLYLYKWLDNGRDRIQSAWVTYKFSNDTSPATTILSCFFFDTTLYFLTQRDDGMHMQRLVFGANLLPSSATEGTFDVHLDQRRLVTTPNVVYSAPYTYITVPYDFDTGASEHTNSEVVIYGGVTTAEYGRRVTVAGTDVSTPGAHKLKITGNYTGYSFYVGQPYTMSCQLSRPVIRLQDATQSGTVIGRWQISKTQVFYENTGNFGVAVQPYPVAVRSAWTETYSPNINYSPGLQNTAVTIGDGRFDAMVLCLNEECTITLQNTTPYPSYFTGLVISGDYSKRVGFSK